MVKGIGILVALGGAAAVIGFGAVALAKAIREANDRRLAPVGGYYVPPTPPVQPGTTGGGGALGGLSGLVATLGANAPAITQIVGLFK